MALENTVNGSLHAARSAHLHRAHMPLVVNLATASANAVAGLPEQMPAASKFCRKSVCMCHGICPANRTEAAKLDLLQERDGLLLFRHLVSVCRISFAQNDSA